MVVPTKDAIIDMTPTEFEKFSLQILEEQLSELNDVKIIQ